MKPLLGSLTVNIVMIFYLVDGTRQASSLAVPTKRSERIGSEVSHSRHKRLSFFRS